MNQRALENDCFELSDNLKHSEVERDPTVTEMFGLAGWQIPQNVDDDRQAVCFSESCLFSESQPGVIWAERSAEQIKSRV